MLLAKLFGLKHIYDMHSSLPIQLITFRRWNHSFFVGIFKILEEFVLRSCDAVIVVGEDLSKLVNKIYPKANKTDDRKLTHSAVYAYTNCWPD